MTDHFTVSQPLKPGKDNIYVISQHNRIQHLRWYIDLNHKIGDTVRFVDSIFICMLSYLMDEVSYVSWVRGSRTERVLVVMMERPLIHTSDPHLDTVWLQGIRLLQLTEVIILKTDTKPVNFSHIAQYPKSCCMSMPAS